MRQEYSILSEPFFWFRRKFAESRSARLIGFGFVASIFLLGSVIALNHLPEVQSIRWSLIVVVALIGVPLTFIFNARRFQLSAKVIGISASPIEALSITLASTASNILPVPGGVAVRFFALKRAETSYRQVGLLTLATALLWVAGALILASICFWFLEKRNLALICAGTGMVTTIVSGRQLWILGSRYIQLIEFLLLQSVLVVLDTFRIFLIIGSLGIAVSYYQVGILGLASIAGSAAGFAPGGLGVREVFAAALGLIVELAPATAFMGTAINRLVGMAVIGSSAAIMAFFGFKDGTLNS